MKTRNCHQSLALEIISVKVLVTSSNGHTKKKMYTQKVINSIPRLKEAYEELESPQAQFAYLQNCFALVNRHGHIFLDSCSKRLRVFTKDEHV